MVRSSRQHRRTRNRSADVSVARTVMESRASRRDRRSPRRRRWLRESRERPICIEKRELMTPCCAVLRPSHRAAGQANPIIIISPSSSALITMYNVKRFLEESVYEPSDVARALSGGPPADVVQITRRRQIGPASGGSGGAGAAGGGGEIRQDGGLTGNSRAERGAQGEKLTRYFVVDGVDALSKFGDDAWYVRPAGSVVMSVFWVHS